MSPLLSVSLTSGVLSGVLIWLCTLFGIPAWLAFIGATSFFASPVKGFSGLTQVWLANASGAIWAIAIISIANVFNITAVGHVATAFFAFIMCFQARFNLLKFIPGTFLGAIAVFSSQGAWFFTFCALFAGAIFGFMMTVSGEILHKKTQAENTQGVNQSIHLFSRLSIFSRLNNR